MGQTKAPEQLPDLDREGITKWLSGQHRQGLMLAVPTKSLAAHWDECRDWSLANGKRRIDWRAAFRMWLRNAQKFALRDNTETTPRNRTVEADRLHKLERLRGMMTREVAVDELDRIGTWDGPPGAYLTRLKGLREIVAAHDMKGEG